VAANAPRVERRGGRQSGITPNAGLDPYMIGFMVVLITLVAKRDAGIVNSQTLGLVQSAAWAAITGMDREFLGEEVLLLSNSHHHGFELGCSNALVFGQALYGDAVADGADEWELWGRATQGAPLANKRHLSATEAFDSESAIADLWAHCFDAHVIEAAHVRSDP
jgi:hypothetical protein